MIVRNVAVMIATIVVLAVAMAVVMKSVSTTNANPAPTRHALKPVLSNARNIALNSRVVMIVRATITGVNNRHSDNASSKSGGVNVMHNVQLTPPSLRHPATMT